MLEFNIWQIMSDSGSLAALKEAQKAGKIRYIAISSHREETAVRVIKSGEFDAIREVCKAVLLDDFAKEQFSVLSVYHAFG